MTISGTIRVRCPACTTEQDAELVQSVNARTSPELKQRLLAGKLNVLACVCGKTTQLAATLLYHDPERDFFCQACPGGEAAIAKGADAFRAIGAVGTQRLVPSTNALIEKIHVLDAGLDDHLVEILKVLLLASIGERDINSIVLFERIEGELLVWVLFRGPTHEILKSPLASYHKLAATAKTLPPSEWRVDRAWAVGAARTIITKAN